MGAIRMTLQQTADAREAESIAAYERWSGWRANLTTAHRRRCSQPRGRLRSAGGSFGWLPFDRYSMGAFVTYVALTSGIVSRVVIPKWNTDGTIGGLLFIAALVK